MLSDMNMKFVFILWENSKRSVNYKIVDSLIPDYEISIGIEIVQLFQQLQQCKLDNYS